MSMGQVGMMVGQQALQKMLQPGAPPQIMPGQQRAPTQSPMPGVFQGQQMQPQQMDVMAFLRSLGLM